MPRNLVLEVEMNQGKNIAKGTYGATSSCNKSTTSVIQDKVICDRNLKNSSVWIHSTEKIETQHISVHSDVSSETGLSLNTRNGGLGTMKAKGNWLYSDEYEQYFILHAALHQIQHKTEISHSNSAHVILPVSLNGSIQKVSAQAKSSRHRYRGTANSHMYKNVEHSAEGPADGNLVSVMAAKITQTSDNVGVWNSEIASEMMSNQNPVIIEMFDNPKLSVTDRKCAEIFGLSKEEFSYELDDALNSATKLAGVMDQKVGSCREASGRSCSTDERVGELVQSNVPNKMNCLTEVRGNVKSCNEQDNCDSFGSNEVVLDPERPRADTCFLPLKRLKMKADSLVTHQSNDYPHGKELPLLTTNTEVTSASNQNPLHCRFDLNECIPANKVEYPKISVESGPSFDAINMSMPIPVVATCGVPTCLPVTPLKFEGEQGWTGSASTSAFRSAFFSKSSNRNSMSSVDNSNCSSKASQGFTEFDLNIAAAGDDSAVEVLLGSCVGKTSGFSVEESSIEVSSKQVKMLNIDLNRLSDNDDNLSQSSPLSLSRHPVVDFDLNDESSVGDACNSAQRSAEAGQPLRSKATDDPPDAFSQDSDQQASHSAEPDLNPMQGFNHGHTQSFVVASPNLLPQIEQMRRMASLQPKLACALQAPPPHAYSCNNGFCIGPTDLLSATINSSAILQHMTDSCGRAIMPQISHPNLLYTSLRAPHLREVAARPRRCGIGPVTGSNINGGVCFPKTGNRGRNAGKFMFPVKKSIRKEQMNSGQQVSSTPMKRRDPDGGWDSFQPSYRNVTSRH
ncbi:uncharacterized protein LOC127798863 [Diospyros lotus]|uniref:uncharacterized protein LOC127798863 n=1 Tax=Diospyros lotus TaxID=55363 RepID=UPI0022538C02|nr:uncharacterized protein LOC127798863 [Diospyros lotus]XP_052188460.1 uncharacterized protein LOC127798863 [Diospyros lotus]